MIVATTKTLKPRRNHRKAGQPFLSVPSPRSNPDGIERKSGSIGILQASALASLPRLVHGFSSKPGGVSIQDGQKVLNLGFTAWDTKENVLENRCRFQSPIGVPDLKPIS